MRRLGTLVACLLLAAIASAGAPPGFQEISFGQPSKSNVDRGDSSHGRVLRYHVSGKHAAALTGKTLCIVCTVPGKGEVKFDCTRNGEKFNSVEHLGYGSPELNDAHSFMRLYDLAQVDEKKKEEKPAAEPVPKEKLAADKAEKPSPKPERKLSKAEERRREAEAKKAAAKKAEAEKRAAARAAAEEKRKNRLAALTGKKETDSSVLEVTDFTVAITVPTDTKDVRFYVSGDFKVQEPTVGNGYYKGRASPDEQEDLTLFAEEIPLQSFQPRPYRLTDNQMGTMNVNGGPVEFRFPERVSLSSFCIANPSHQMLLYADTDGDGKFETTLDESGGLPNLAFKWDDHRDYYWRRVKPEKPLLVKSVLYVGWGDEARLYGRRVKGHLPKPPKLKSAPQFNIAGTPDRTVTEVPDEDKLWFGFVVEPWMFGSFQVFRDYYANGAVGPIPPFSTWLLWKNVVADYKTLNANFMLMFPPKTFIMPPGMSAVPGLQYCTPVIWPSKVWWRTEPFDILREYVTECHQHGILTFVTPRQWLFKDGVQDGKVLYAQEIGERLADGVPTCCDEEYIFTGRSGASNTPEGRAAYVRYMKSLAEPMARTKANLDKINRKAYTFGAYAGCDYHWDRFMRVSGCDWWGFEGKVDVIGGDGTYFGVGTNPEGTYIPYVATTLQVSCSAKRLSMGTINFNWATAWRADEKRYYNGLVYDDFPAWAHSAGALATYFAKAKFMDFWRYNFMVVKGGPAERKAIEDVGFMVKKLAEWGGWKAQVPKDVLVLRSRTSEDWWNLRYMSDPIPEDVDRVAMRQYGRTLFWFTGCTLCAESAPYEVYLLNRPETWIDRVNDYKVIVLPFAYAISDEAAKAICTAAKKHGVKVIAPGDYPLAEVDDTGAKRKKRAFAGVKVVRVKFDPARGGYGDAAQVGLRTAVRQALDEHGGGSLALERDPRHDLQAYMLEASPTEKFMMLANWCEYPAEANVCLNLPEKEIYRMDVCTGVGVQMGKLGGKTRLEARDLKCFRVSMDKGEVLLIRVRPMY